VNEATFWSWALYVKEACRRSALKLRAEYRDSILTLVSMVRGVMGTLKVISAFSSVTLVTRYRSKLCHNTEHHSMNTPTVACENQPNDQNFCR
jgi:hypothetical protein